MQRHFPTLVQSIALGALASITLIACDDSSHNDPISCDSIDECPANHECQENVCVDQRDAIPKTCGNGTIDDGEICDDGENNGKPNHCSVRCDGPTPSVCGNGIVEAGEECDDVGASASCNADCTAARCGDGIVNTWAGETCDAGEQNGTPNHCNNQCKGTTTPVCGNGVIGEGEVCDDGENRSEEHTSELQSRGH